MTLSEREKYERIWMEPSYRECSPGERLAQTFIDMSEPCTVIDFGAGTGRASRLLQDAGYDVHPVDIAKNCLDADVGLANTLTVADITEGLDISAEYGYCTDVMEHIPTDRVDAALRTISGAVRRCFFSICFIDEPFGGLIGETLHLTVRSREWWRGMLSQYGRVLHEGDYGVFLVEFDR